jgi:hypothetical protein
MATHEETKTVYAYFTLREWKIITEALVTRRPLAGYYVVECDDQYVTPSEIDDILIKCPSASLPATLNQPKKG